MFFVAILSVQLKTNLVSPYRILEKFSGHDMIGSNEMLNINLLRQKCYLTEWLSSLPLLRFMNICEMYYRQITMKKSLNLKYFFFLFFKKKMLHKYIRQWVKTNGVLSVSKRESFKKKWFNNGFQLPSSVKVGLNKINRLWYYMK